MVHVQKNGHFGKWLYGITPHWSLPSTSIALLRHTHSPNLKIFLNLQLGSQISRYFPALVTDEMEAGSLLAGNMERDLNLAQNKGNLFAH